MAGNNRKLVILQDRDLHLLRELAVMRVVDREQAEIVAPFGSTTRANARLLALTGAGFLHRFFWGTVGGARKALYSLSPRGAALAGVPHRRPRRGQDAVLAMDSSTAHQLQVNAIYCALKYPKVPQVPALVRWIAFQEPVDASLLPDGYAEVTLAGTTLALFFEVDLGTEGRKIWEEKVRSYVSFAASGGFAAKFGQPRFLALAVANSESRLTSLRSATATITDKIFRFTTVERISRETFWGTIWQKPAGQERQPLFSNQ